MSIDRLMRLGQVFTPGAPINDRALFAGRAPQITQLLSTISKRGYHAVLYGERGVGKTSLANILTPLLLESGNPFLLCRVNCDTSDTFSSIWRKALRDITFTTMKPGLGFVADSKKEALPLQLPEEILPDDVRRMLTQVSASAIPVIVFDEFDRITESKTTAEMADTIKALSDYSIPATIIMIGVADSVDELIKEHQSIERNLTQIPMPRMSDDEVDLIVRKGFEILELIPEKGVAEHLVELSQGIPYVAHMLALHTAQAAIQANSNSVYDMQLSEGIHAALDQWNQSVKSTYNQATHSHQPGTLYKQVLLSCALAEVDDLRFFAAASVRKPLRVITGKDYDIPGFARHLKDLASDVRGGVLQRTGEQRRVRYRFTSPLLRPYIIIRGFNERLITKAMYRDLQS